VVCGKPEIESKALSSFCETGSLGTVSIRISHQRGDKPPVVIQNAKIVHNPSVLIHTGANNFDSLGVIELAVQVKGYRASEAVSRSAIVNVGDTRGFFEAGESTSREQPTLKKVSFEELNRLAGSR